jgi:hypothetical protein
MTDERVVHRLVNATSSCRPKCPASPARVKGALRASQAIEQTALDP